MDLFENLKAYFDKKQDYNTVDVAPKGVCPNCWGEQEWDGEFYRKIKSKSANRTNLYNTFIKKVVSKLDKITLKGATYKCETCVG